MPTSETTFAEVIAALDEADARLREVYRSLADDPGRVQDYESELHALHTKRRDLAEAVGLAVLAQRRASVANSNVDDVAVEPADRPTLPEVVVPAEVSAPEPPISAEALDEWKQRARTNGVGTVTYEDRAVPTWERTLDKLMTQVGAPRALDLDLDDELDALDKVGRDPLIEQWVTLPPKIQQQWLGLLVARTRAAKIVEGISVADRARVKTIISRYPAWAGEHRPGHVHGLRVDHEPESSSWDEDARRLWAALVHHLQAETLTGPRQMAQKRRKVDDEESIAESVRPIDPAWSLWPRVRGRSVVMVGGDPREPNRQRLEKLFELRSLEWPDVAGPRKLGAVVARIRGGTVDIVVVLKGLVDHKQSEPIIAAAKDAKVAWALAESYGAASIKAGLDRFLSRS
jgi:hypothetical protein